MLVAADDRFATHDTGPGHPECPERLAAVADGLRAAGALTDTAMVEPRAAARAELERVHPAEYLEALADLCSRGGGRVDADTVVSSRSWEVARLAAGTGLAVVESLRSGVAGSAFCAIRPPGHHAVPARGMGFCLLNNIAVAAAAIRAAGERVMILDWDAHHGNGTQDVFIADPDVLFVSLHEWPLYPGTGGLREVGTGAGAGASVNLPLPAGATGDVYRHAIDSVIGPAAERFAPDWVLVSAGFDGHRADPLTGLGLSAGDYADLATAAMRMAPPGRLVLFLEGGYDLDAVRRSVEATATALLGAPVLPERPSSGGPGRDVVDAARAVHSL